MVVQGEEWSFSGQVDAAFWRVARFAVAVFAVLAELNGARRELCPLTSRKDRSRALETSGSCNSFNRSREDWN